MLSGRGRYVGLITCPEESYRVLFCLNVFVKEAVVHWGGAMVGGGEECCILDNKYCNNILQFSEDGV